MLLGSAGALSLVQCSSSDNNPRLLGGFPINPTSPCDVLLPANEHRATIAMMALVGGSWGFGSFGLERRLSFEFVRELTLRGEITINISGVQNGCEADCVFPSIARYESGNPFDSLSVSEGFPQSIIATNVFCGGSPGERATDYLFALESLDRNLAGRTDFALFWPHAQLMMTSAFEEFGVTAERSCVSPGFDVRIGVAQILIREWPVLSRLFVNDERITVTAINVVGQCPNADCTAQGSTFSLCFGPPLASTYHTLS